MDQPDDFDWECDPRTSKCTNGQYYHEESSEDEILDVISPAPLNITVWTKTPTMHITTATPVTVNIQTLL